MIKTAAGATIQLASGNYFDFLDPDNSIFTIEDIAIGESKTCRYGGHCNGFYSVAEHSVYVSQIVDPEFAFAGLMHDATEAFTGDIPGPLKRILPEFKALERQLDKAILGSFGIDEIPPQVKVADLQMLATERDQLMPQTHDDWPFIRGIEPIDIEIKQLNPSEAQELFLARFFELTNI